ncbi:MAG: hypothetical protein DRJ52_06215 [Thermoprotei archaeon]|nr:MAG: hypothetical protein DRJ52_06215 [Thermoprotei archaeon]
MNKKGQFLLLAAIILAISLLISLSFYRKPTLSIIVYRGYIQASELVALARVWVKSDFCPLCIAKTSRELLQLNKTYQLNIPRTINITVKSYELDLYDGFKNYTIVFYTKKGKYVRVVVYYEYHYQNSYFKKVKGEEILYYNYTLRYFHEYEGPWGSLIKYPVLSDPNQLADIRYLGLGLWAVGVPSNSTPYVLLDEFEIRIQVGGS